MALTRLNAFGTGSILTNTQITGEFDNIYNNALSLISPLTGNLAAGGFSITGLALGSVSSPALQFTGDTNTGVYSSGADALDLSAGGLRLMTLTSTPVAGIVSVDPGAISATASTNVGRLFVGGTSALTIPAGTTAIASGLWVAEPNFTATGTITRATTVYVAAAPTEGGTNNYAVWVDAGDTRLDGNLIFGASGSGLSVYTTSTFTATATGFTTSPTGTVYYTQIGNIVTMFIPTISATSNATTLTYTGMPAAIYPARNQYVMCGTLDNGGSYVASSAVIDTSGVINFFKNVNQDVFTNTGTKAVLSMVLTYTLN